MKKINLLLRKCKSLSSQLGRSSSYSSLRSKSKRDDLQDFYWASDHQGDDDHEQHREIVYVGKSRRRYVINSKYLSHPLLNALIEKSSNNKKQGDGKGEDILLVKCEVVLFDHLLWMLKNGDPNLISDSFEELAELYVF